MTAPTPVEAASGAIESAPIGAPVTLPYSQAVALWSALAAVTAEREGFKFLLRKTEDELHQARQMLADAEKKIASMELDESLREEDERFADPL